MKKLVIASALCATLCLVGGAEADADITQRCVASSIKERGNYVENDDGSWTVTCCGKAQRADGGFMGWPPELGDCESATAATRALALSTCRSNWQAKRCP